MLLRTLARRVTYANVTSTICLFMLLGGSAYAAASITGRDVRNGSLTGADIKDHSLRARDFRAGELPRGPQGVPGPQGPKGDAGPAGTAVAAPAASREPAGRLILPGIAGDGPGGAITVRGIAWSNVVSGDPYGGGGAGGKPAWGDLVVTKAPDGSSTRLWKLAASGQPLASAKLQLLAPGANAPYTTYTLKAVRVTRFTTSGTSGERRDEVTLHFDPALQPNPVFAFDSTAPIPAAGDPQVGTMTVDGIAGQIPLRLDAWSVDSGSASLLGPFVVAKAVDSASSALLTRFASGMHIKQATVQLLQPGSATAATKYVLTDVVVTSFAVRGDGQPLERLGLDAGRVEATTPMPGGQTVRSCWDRKLNASC